MRSEFNPFSMFLPLSGNVDQNMVTPWFSPTITTNNFAGDAGVEERVVKDVASYGTQLGCLNEIVLALANKKVPSAKAMKQLAKVVEEVDEIKARQRKSGLENAVDALNALRRTQPEAYARLIQERARSA
jgi:hypothetical protein